MNIFKINYKSILKILIYKINKLYYKSSSCKFNLSNIFSTKLLTFLDLYFSLFVFSVHKFLVHTKKENFCTFIKNGLKDC